MKMPDRMNGAWFVFFLGLSIPVLLIPRTAYAAATCDAITGKLPGSNPGNLTLNSPIIDQSGLPLGDALKPLGFIAKLKQLSQLSGW